MKCRSILLVLLFSVCLPSFAFAVPVQLTLGENPIVQQVNNSPCVIGNPSCNNPVGFGYTLIPANDSADSLSSPTYTVDQIRGVAGNVFAVGIDLQEPDNDYHLESFSLLINNSIEFLYSGSVLAINNHGNGFSDWALSGFDLSTFAGASTAQFQLVYSDAQADREQFFLAGRPLTNPVGDPIPEPMSAALLGMGVTVLIPLRKRA